MVEDQRLHFGILRRFELLRVACSFFHGSSVALRINIRGKKNVLAVWRPEFTACFGRNGGQLVLAPPFRHAIELRNPNLRSAFLRRDERKPLAIRRPARAVGILIGDDLALLTSGRRHDPDVRRLGVGRQIHVDHAEDHPLAVRRNLRLADALELHHVFEGEGMLGLRKGWKGEER